VYKPAHSVRGEISAEFPTLHPSKMLLMAWFLASIYHFLQMALACSLLPMEDAIVERSLEPEGMVKEN
jgi:hypothetical protein